MAGGVSFEHPTYPGFSRAVSAGGRVYMYYAAGAISEENGIYEILDYDTPNPSFMLRNNIAGHPSGDGASCANADTPFSIQAASDNFSSNPIQDCNGGVVGSIFDNDTLYGDDFDPSSVNLSLENDGGLTGVSLNPNGEVEVPGRCFAPGIYTVVYRICDAASPDVCSTANITLRFLAASAPGSGDPPSAETDNSFLAPTGDNLDLIVALAISLIATSFVVLRIGRWTLNRE